MLKGSKKPLTEEKKRELELFFLESVQERIGLDVAAVERGGVPRKWEGDVPPSREDLEQLHKFHRQIGEAIAHVRAGGPLDETPAILWGLRATRT